MPPTSRAAWAPRRAASRLLAAALVLLSGGCTAPVREAAAPAADAAPPGVPHAPPLQDQPVVAAPTTPPKPPSAPRDPWTRVRAGLRFADCHDIDAPTAAARASLLRDRRALTRQWARILPRLEYVLTALEDAALPTEFALLPLVESGYRPLPAQGNRPAGDWQFMPGTARAQGLTVNPQHDARLDLAAATAAAIRLLGHLGATFDGDWALATMAFNAGEFRVRRARLAQPGAPPHGLRVAPVTRTHLARLRAMACIVAAPPVAGIELPQWDASRRLVALPLSRSLPLGEAARMAGLAPESLRALNPAPRDARIRAGANLLLPADAAARLAPALAALPPADPAHDAGHVVRTGDSLWTIARRHGTSVQALARHNRIDPSRPLRPGQLLRLPPD